jgi:hypothetical protein
MKDSSQTSEIGNRLSAIRANLARMREESRVSLARLAATREEADDRVAARARDDETRAQPGGGDALLL